MPCASIPAFQILKNLEVFMKFCMDIVPSDINSNLLPFLMLNRLKFKINVWNIF